MDIRAKNLAHNIGSIAILGSILTCSVSCSKISGGSADSATVYEMSASALEVMDGVLSDEERSSSVSFNSQNIEAESFAACGASRFNPSLGSSDCSGTDTNTSTVIANYANCTVGTGGTLNGTVTMTFSTPASCTEWIDVDGTLPTDSSTVTRTSSDFTRTTLSGAEILTSSASHSNYLGQSIGGGVQTTFGETTRSISVLGLHKVRTRNFRTIFDHSFHTSTPLVVSGRRFDSNRRIVSGALVVDHNLSEFTSTLSFTNLTYSDTCCYPTGGTLGITNSGATDVGYTFTFSSTCGEVSVSSGASITDVTLDDCN